MPFESLSEPSKELLRNLLFNLKERSITRVEQLASSDSKHRDQELKAVYLLRKAPINWKRWKRKRLDLFQAVCDHEQNNICPLTFPIKSNLDAMLNLVYSLALTELIENSDAFDPTGMEGHERSVTTDLIQEILWFLDARQAPMGLLCTWRELEKKSLERLRS